MASIPIRNLEVLLQTQMQRDAGTVRKIGADLSILIIFGAFNTWWSENKHITPTNFENLIICIDAVFRMVQWNRGRVPKFGCSLPVHTLNRVFFVEPVSEK